MLDAALWQFLSALAATDEEWAYLCASRGFHKQACDEGSVICDVQRR